MIEALLPKTRRSVLGLLFARPDQAFYLREIVRATGAGRGAVERELRSLAEAGIVTREPRGNLTYYRANRDCPIYTELRGLALKTTGLVDVLRDALSGLRGVKVAFVYGSLARGDDDAASDVDLLVVGHVAFGKVAERLHLTHETLGRELNPTIYSVEEFRQKVAEKHHFITRVLEGPKLFVIGDADALSRLAGTQVGDKAPSNA
jgi:predicted nucleotidyltransferase